MLKELLDRRWGKAAECRAVFREVDCLEEILMSTLFIDIWDVVSAFIDELLA